MTATDLFGQPLHEGLFELTPAVTKKLSRRQPVLAEVPPVQIEGDVIRLNLPRWDTMHVQKKRRGGWPMVDPVTKKIVTHRPVWEALRGNARSGHYGQRLNATRVVIAAVVTAATNAGLKPCHHLTVQLVWSPGDHRRADEDNLVALQKVCCDALARGRSDIPGLHLVPDDTSKWMRKEMPRIDRPPPGQKTGPSGLWLEVKVG